MPAAPSSLTDPAIGQLLTTAQALGSDRARLLPVLAAVPDPRARRGVRHRLAVILSLAVCAVLAGARSFTAIAEWAADADQVTREALGVTGVVPSESTFRRTLQNLDADALDDAAGAWAQQRTAPAPGARRMIAVDGKTLRGSGVAGGPGRHLLAALDHAHGVVLGQVDVEAKTNEIPMFATLLGPYWVTAMDNNKAALGENPKVTVWLRSGTKVVGIKRNWYPSDKKQGKDGADVLINAVLQLDKATLTRAGDHAETVECEFVLVSVEDIELIAKVSPDQANSGSSAAADKRYQDEGTGGTRAGRGRGDMGGLRAGPGG
jgi:hypothetical protein